MTADHDLTDQLLDLVLYAPLGLALEARDLLPKLAERGRGQVNLVRFAGRVASRQGRSDPRGFVDGLLGAVGAVFPGRQTPRAGTRPTGASEQALPIRDYDTLTAPEVLPHLDPLSAGELDEVLAYEEDHRGRATVINRIRQLQG